MYQDLITASLVPPARITVSENQQVQSDKAPTSKLSRSNQLGCLGGEGGVEVGLVGAAMDGVKIRPRDL